MWSFAAPITVACEDVSSRRRGGPLMGWGVWYAPWAVPLWWLSIRSVSYILPGFIVVYVRRSPLVCPIPASVALMGSNSAASVESRPLNPALGSQ